MYVERAGTQACACRMRVLPRHQSSPSTCMFPLNRRLLSSLFSFLSSGSLRNGYHPTTLILLRVVLHVVLVNQDNTHTRNRTYMYMYMCMCLPASINPTCRLSRSAARASTSTSATRSLMEENRNSREPKTIYHM